MEFDGNRALDSVDLTVDRGTVTALLGHNGAGKTTLVRVLTTLLPPTSGAATVAGFDVVREPLEVRRRIGLTGQTTTVDENLSGRDNLVLVARLLGADPGEAAGRARELLELFGLTDAADRVARTYSGGMRRRLDLAASLVGRPEVVFLDEPTTGLDPVSRLNLWGVVESLVRDGVAVLLTTQYLDEADRLADRIVVLSGGRVAARGTADELKSRFGTRTARLSVDRPDLDAAVAALARAGLSAEVDGPTGRVTASLGAADDVAALLRAVGDAGFAITEFDLSRPTLDDVYLELAGESGRAARATSRPERSVPR